MACIENKAEEWEKLSRQYFLGEIQDETITVTVGSSEEENSDITCLRYFFPLCHGLHRSGIIPYDKPMYLDINTSKMLTDKQDYSMRIKAFLCAIRSSEEYKIYIDGKELFVKSNEWDGSKIFPLIKVFADKYAQPGDHYSILQRKELPRGISDSNTIAKLYHFRDVLKAKVLSLDVYAGTHKNPIKTANKEELSNILNTNLSQWLPQMNILAQIIWLYILRILIETKEIWHTDSDKITKVDENKIQKSRIDAVNYGEGMYQLIENSCLHSDGQTAWFAFRVHSAGGQIAMSDFFAEAKTREHLNKKYKYCYTEILGEGKEKNTGNSIFNKKDRFFFEFFVLDDAYKQTGILETYNRPLIKTKYKKLWLQKEEQRKQERETNCANDEDYKNAYPQFVEEKFDENSIQDVDLWNTAVKTLKEQGVLIEKIAQIIHKKPVEGPYETAQMFTRHLEDITTHYGLRLLDHIVGINNGYLMCKTPQQNGDIIKYYDGNDRDDCKDENIYTTEWHTIMPISYQWQVKQAQDIRLETGGAFGNTVKPKRSNQINIDAISLFDNAALESSIYRCTSVDDKKRYIYAIAKHLSVYLPEEKYALLSDTVILINIDIDNSWMLELFSKALYSTIAKIHYKQKGTVPLRIALSFKTVDFCNEFIRLFSMFYLGGKQADMVDTQIAICSTDENGLNQCNYILAGACLDSVWESANISAHYGSKATLERLPVLAYLTQYKKQSQKSVDREKIELFPFDLYLNKSDPQIDPWKNSWFLEQMDSLLKMDLQSSQNGCLIEDVHIRLGSKVHLPCFFEAQLLFHDSGYIFRFAYLVAQDLLYGTNALPVNKHIFLLGYEKYSAQFVQQVSYWLSQSEKFKSINTAIIRDGQEEGSVLFEPLFDKEQCFLDAGIEVVSFAPVGTTMSTIYKMHSAARSYFPEVLALADFSRNYCMVLVNDELSNPSGTLSEVTKRYWSSLEPEQKIVTLQREKSDKKEVKVKYLLSAAAQWFAPDECTLCKETASDIRPIITVTKSDVMPSSIFPLRGRKHGFFSNFMTPNDLVKNNQRIYRLLGNIRYSHLYKYNNHFQFFIDFEKLFRENKDDIVKVMQSWTIQPNAYNIVVSPLLIENSSFVQAVLDYVFHGNSKFVHLEFLKSYREEVRSKFSHISEEIKILRSTNRDARINIYFIDVSIISGSVINRAKILLRMLLEEAGVDCRNVALFKSIFLLVNRCSYDSINSFINNPEKNLKTYINLAVPSYNVDEGSCPACNLVTKYRLLKKRSATKKLGNVFMRLEEKHKKRTSSEYEVWLKHEIYDNPSYFTWLKQWLYINVSKTKKRILFFDANCRDAYYQRFSSAVNAEAKEHQTAQWLASVITEYHNNASQTTPSDPHTLSKAIMSYRVEHKNNFDNEVNAAENLILTHLIGMRSYMRLHSLHTAYHELEQATQNITILKNSITQNQYTTVRKAMLKMIADAISLCNENNSTYKNMVSGIGAEEKSRFQFVSRIEWLISYIKVLSREHLANHYCYRQAIASIMRDLLNILGSEEQWKKNYNRLKGEDENWAVIADAIQPICCEASPPNDKKLYSIYHYHLNMMLLHRMADLQIRPIIQTDYIIKLVKQYHVFKEIDNATIDAASNTELLSLPTAEDVIERFLKTLKASTMALDDDIPCLSLCKTVDELASRIQLSKNRPAGSIDFSEVVAIGRYIYLENIRMIYSGLFDLRKQISIEQSEEWKAYRPCDNFLGYVKMLNKKVRLCLSSCYNNLDGEANEEDILYQNPLNNFCRFWHKANGCAPFKSCQAEDEIDSVTYMLLYYMRLEMLSKLKDTTKIIDELPYQYEELCRAICGFTKAQMCYLVYCNDGNYPEIFAQSGYYIPFFDNGSILTSQKVDVILRCASNAERELSETCPKLLPDITQVNYENQGYLVLNIALQGQENTGKHFHIVLQCEKPYAEVSANQITGIEALRQARDILFMRETLQEVLSEHYTILANMRFDSSYIRPLVSPTLGASPNPTILHFSDLHISRDMANFIEDPDNPLGKSLDNALSTRKIDLLAITGDIADARDGDAVHLSKNYLKAQKVLDYIVKKLWGDDTNYLPHDWKRRIMITTGNHDYAAMNQFRSVLKQRVLSVGTPVEEDGGTMSKFAYFIDFLIRYLDPPIDELLQNDLNEIRYYRNLNLKVLVLNCSSNATARRTNKLGLDIQKVKQLLRRKVWEDDKGCNRPFKLCLAHYSDRYSLSYFIDNYNVIPGWEWNTQKSEACAINNLIHCFASAMRAELVYIKAELLNKEANGLLELPTSVKDKSIPDWVKELTTSAREELVRRVDFFNDAMTEWEQNCPASRLEHEPYHNRLQEYYKSKMGINQPISPKSITSSIRDNDLYQEIMYYRNWVMAKSGRTNAEKRTDERISRMIFEINESLSMSEYDKKTYSELFVEEETSFRKIDLMLAGHIHAYAEQQGTLVADRMFNSEQNSINGYIIYDMEIRTDKTGNSVAGYQHQRF